MHSSAYERRESLRGRSRQTAWSVAAVLLLAFAALPGSRGSEAPAKAQQDLELTSASFQGGQIPRKFTCNGAEISPQLAWSAPPAATASFALIVTDPDAPFRIFTHWVLYDLPAETRTLPEDLPAQDQLANGARQGHNSYGRIGYAGPCPPRNSPHHYVFTLYALDAKLNLPAGARRKQVEAAMQGRILARGELIGLYRR